jgi:uncharacterized protein (DUF1330 family)
MATYMIFIREGEVVDAQAAKAWYYSDEYQAAIKDRQLAAPYRCIMVEGFTIPG